MSLHKIWRYCYWLWLWTTWRKPLTKHLALNGVYKPWLPDSSLATRHWWQRNIFEHDFLWAAKLARTYSCFGIFFYFFFPFWCYHQAGSHDVYVWLAWILSEPGLCSLCGRLATAQTDTKADWKALTKTPKKHTTNNKKWEQKKTTRAKQFLMLSLTCRDLKLVHVVLSLSSYLARFWQHPISHPLFILQAVNQAVCAQLVTFTPSWRHWSDQLIKNLRH